MPYQYDVFMSYMHDEQMAPWVHQHLVPFTKTFVGNALGRPISIFVDRNGIASGDSWPQRLKGALAQSRCLVAVWSPLYFDSEWCRKECRAMFYREARLGYRTTKRPSGLVMPVNVFDEEFFPEVARHVQWLDCRKYWVVGEGFSKTERYIDFQDILRAWSLNVAQAISAAPPWQEHWLRDEWLDLPDNDLRPKPVTNFDFTGLE